MRLVLILVYVRDVEENIKVTKVMRYKYGYDRQLVNTEEKNIANPSWRFQESPRCFGIKRF